MDHFAHETSAMYEYGDTRMPYRRQEEVNSAAWDKVALATEGNHEIYIAPSIFAIGQTGSSADHQKLVIPLAILLFSFLRKYAQDDVQPYPVLFGIHLPRYTTRDAPWTAAWTCFIIIGVNKVLRAQWCRAHSTPKSCQSARERIRLHQYHINMFFRWQVPDYQVDGPLALAWAVLLVAALVLDPTPESMLSVIASGLLWDCRYRSAQSRIFYGIARFFHGQMRGLLLRLANSSARAQHATSTYLVTTPLSALLRSWNKLLRLGISHMQPMPKWEDMDQLAIAPIANILEREALQWFYSFHAECSAMLLKPLELKDIEFVDIILSDLHPVEAARFFDCVDNPPRGHLPVQTLVANLSDLPEVYSTVLRPVLWALRNLYTIALPWRDEEWDEAARSLLRRLPHETGKISDADIVFYVETLYKAACGVPGPARDAAWDKLTSLVKQEAAARCSDVVLFRCMTAVGFYAGPPKNGAVIHSLESLKRFFLSIEITLHCIVRSLEVPTVSQWVPGYCATVAEVLPSARIVLDSRHFDRRGSGAHFVFTDGIQAVLPHLHTLCRNASDPRMQTENLPKRLWEFVGSLQKVWPDVRNAYDPARVVESKGSAWLQAHTAELEHIDSELKELDVDLIERGGYPGPYD
ncbi:hypothetical protein VTO73DRAFT_10719 [Trametes versicolor]